MHEESFIIGEHVIGLRWLERKGESAFYRGAGLFWFPGFPIGVLGGRYFSYQRGTFHRDELFPEGHGVGRNFDDFKSLSAHHQKAVRPMLRRFYELVGVTPEALQMMGLAGYIVLEQMVKGAA